MLDSPTPHKKLYHIIYDKGRACSVRRGVSPAKTLVKTIICVYQNLPLSTTQTKLVFPIVPHA